MRLTRKIITSQKTMETLSLHNLRRFQTRRGEQNLKPYRRRELRKQHTLWKHLLRKKLMKKMMRLLTENWREYNKKYNNFRKRRTHSRTNYFLNILMRSSPACSRKKRFANQREAKKKGFRKARKT
jgi:hypothetical protein